MNAKGFTLIELMIVVAIVGILAGVGYPSYQQYILESHRDEAKVGLFKIQLLQEQFYLDNDAYALSLTSGTEGKTALSGWGGDSEFYNFSLDASSGEQSYTVIATVDTDTTQNADTNCQRFSLDNFGEQLAYNATSEETTNDCW